MSVPDQTAPRRARIELRPVGAARAIMVTVLGAVTDPDAAELSRYLHAALDAGPAVVVVNLSSVQLCEPAGVRVLVEARDRAHTAAVALHLLHLGDPEARSWLDAADLSAKRAAPSRTAPPRPSPTRSCQPSRRRRSRRPLPREATCAPR